MSRLSLPWLRLGGSLICFSRQHKNLYEFLLESHYHKILILLSCSIALLTRQSNPLSLCSQNSVEGTLVALVAPDQGSYPVQTIWNCGVTAKQHSNLNFSLQHPRNAIQKCYIACYTGKDTSYTAGVIYHFHVLYKFLLLRRCLDLSCQKQWG